jgi:hypothetical protein
MGDSMRNHPGFATAGAGQDQQRALGVFGGFPLARVEPLQKIHEVAILARGLKPSIRHTGVVT